MATDERADAMVALADEIHSQTVNLARRSYEYICELPDKNTVGVNRISY